MWNEGLRIHEAAHAASTQALANAVAKYREVAGVEEPDLTKEKGVIGFVYAVVRHFERSELLIQQYQYLKIDDPRGPGPFDNEVLYRKDDADPRRFWGVDHKVQPPENDPYDIALKAGLIERVPYWWAPGSTGENSSTRYKILAKAGPRAGTELMANMALMESWTTRSGLRGLLRSWVPVSEVKRNDPRELLDACVDLVRNTRDFQRAQDRIASVLGQAVNAAAFDPRLKELQDVGTIAQLFAVIAQWRHTSRSVNPMLAASLANVRSIATGEPLVAVVAKIVSEVRTPLSDKFSWSSYVSEGLRNAIIEVCTAMEERGSELEAEQGIPVVDDTLKALGGYMRLKKIAFPLPAKSTPPRINEPKNHNPADNKERHESKSVDANRQSRD